MHPTHLNLGIVAHVDAGKTSLTERLLFAAGVTDTLGSVDAGTTRTDSLDLERRRGITIRAAVTTFPLRIPAGEVTVNLLDTPGHPDFIAEVERSLTVLDAAVLVLSAVEGVQPQTVVIWRALRRLGVPTLLFVNKVDRGGADVDRVVGQVRRRLTGSVVPLTAVTGAGRREATVRALPLTDDSVIESVAEGDDRLLARWVDGRPTPAGEVRRALRRGVRRGAVFPLLCGSAITGAGVAELSEAVVSLLRPSGLDSCGLDTSPVPRDGSTNEGCSSPVPRDGSTNEGFSVVEPASDALSSVVEPASAASGVETTSPSGTVFAVDRDERGRRAWVRMWGGSLGLRDRVTVGGGRPTPVTELSVSAPGGPRPTRTVGAGVIAVIRGPAARIGDTIGRPPERRTHRFPPATLQALVEPEDPRQRGALFAGLADLADEDPLIDLRIDESAGEAAVSLHGEVQKETIAAMLADRYGVRARFLDTTVVCIERVRGSGAATDRIGENGNPYLAGVGLRIDSAPGGHRVGFSPGVERGNLPPAFVAATEEGVRAALRQGRHGWAVTDCVVTMTSSQYCPRQSKPHQRFDKSISTVAADFRLLSQVVVMAALDEAGTSVCEPVERFDLELPDASYAALAALLGRLGGTVLDTRPLVGYLGLEGHLPSAAVPELAARLPDLTSGEGVLVTRLDHHAPVTASRPPGRRRAGIDPRDRAAWFREMKR